MGRETKSPAWSFFIQIKGIDFWSLGCTFFLT
jgi:hypothetical protein